MSIERCGQLFADLSRSPTAKKLKLRQVLAMAIEGVAPELIAPDGSVDVRDLRRIVQAATDSR